MGRRKSYWRHSAFNAATGGNRGGAETGVPRGFVHFVEVRAGASAGPGLATIQVRPEGAEGFTSEIASGWIRTGQEGGGSQPIGALRWHGAFPVSRDEAFIRVFVRNDSGSDIFVEYQISGVRGFPD